MLGSIQPTHTMAASGAHLSEEGRGGVTLLAASATRTAKEGERGRIFEDDDSVATAFCFLCIS